MKVKAKRHSIKEVKKIEYVNNNSKYDNSVKKIL